VTREAVTVADLDREARARLSSFKVPKRWVLLGSPSEVPTMATGKVDKPALQDLIREVGEAARSPSV
jgi:acyl-CoA synthetase (AMP-forming)/AMP-acid ligase II